MKTEIRRFILDTLLEYKQDRSNCAIDSLGTCMYLTEDNKKCAVGKHMIEGEHQYFNGGFSNLIKEYDKRDVLTPKAISMNLNNTVWSKMQSYHDYIASNSSKSTINTTVKILETYLDIELPELLFEE